VQKFFDHGYLIALAGEQFNGAANLNHAIAPTALFSDCRSKRRVVVLSSMKLVIAATGASGTIYLQRLFEQIDCAAHEVHLVMSAHAKQVAAQEIDRLQIPKEVAQRAENDLNVPFVSGSAHFDAMVIVPCSMATLGRIASGSSDTALLRAADVFLKERRKLILVPRETPWNLIHARNVVTLLEAGAIVLPAIPSFYSRPKSLVDVVDTVVWRILDQVGLPNPRAFRWSSGGRIGPGRRGDRGEQSQTGKPRER
jgi:flavin prenyltransferase